MDKKLTRAFIAIDFSDSVIKEVARLQELIKNKPFTGKFTELGNLHLTLKFLGEIDDEKLEKIKEKLDQIKIDRFNANLGELGIFHVGKLKAPKIAWIKINGKEIWTLQKEIDEKLKELFKVEERFMSHTTIARIRYVKDKKGFEEYISKLNVKNIKFEINCFKLMSSELKENGPIYKEIKIFSLN